MVTFEDVLAVPGAYCLYDAAGLRIAASVSWTGQRRRGPTPPRIDVPEDVARVDEPVVFGGLLPKAHFGHVLLEMFTRLWVFDAGVVDGRTPLRYFTHYGRALEPFEQQLLAAALDGVATDVAPISRPTRFARISVPSQAIVLDQPMDPAVLPLYDRVRDRLVGDVRRDERPLYLSRSRLSVGKRRTLGERSLQDRLQRSGVRVVHPETLPLQEQVRLVTGAATVIGLSGSALHLTMLRDLPGGRTISLDARSPYAPQREVERVRGATFHHLHAQYPLHPRLPGGAAWELGDYRNFVLPGPLGRRILRLL